MSRTSQGAGTASAPASPQRRARARVPRSRVDVDERHPAPWPASWRDELRAEAGRAAADERAAAPLRDGSRTVRHRLLSTYSARSAAATEPLSSGRLAGQRPVRARPRARPGSARRPARGSAAIRSGEDTPTTVELIRSDAQRELQCRRRERDVVAPRRPPPSRVAARRDRVVARSRRRTSAARRGPLDEHAAAVRGRVEHADSALGRRSRTAARRSGRAGCTGCG